MSKHKKMLIAGSIGMGATITGAIINDVAGKSMCVGWTLIVTGAIFAIVSCLIIDNG